MKQLTFDEFDCKKSLANRWYCHIEVKLDGSGLKEPYMLGARLKAGETADPAAPFSKGYYFSTEATFSMELEDRFQLQIVTHEVATDADGAHTTTFTHEGNWEVEVSYTVSDVGTIDTLQQAVDDFRDGIQVAANSNAFTRWEDLSHTAIVDRAEKLGTRVGNPTHADTPPQYAIDQADLGYCGLVSIMFVSAYRQPRRFVETCRSLYETGGFLTQSGREESSGALQHSPAGDDMPDLEWLYCASLFETRPDIDTVTGSDPNRGAPVTEMARWFSEVLGYDEVWQYFDAVLLDERAMFDHAVQAVDNGGAAILVCDSDFATDAVLIEGERPFFNDGDHAVSMVLSPDLLDAGDPDDLDDDEFMFSIHSWGRAKLVVMEWDDIEEFLYGAVLGWS